MVLRVIEVISKEIKEFFRQVEQEIGQEPSHVVGVVSYMQSLLDPRLSLQILFYRCKFGMLSVSHFFI